MTSSSRTKPAATRWYAFSAEGCRRATRRRRYGGLPSRSAAVAANFSIPPTARAVLAGGRDARRADVEQCVEALPAAAGSAVRPARRSPRVRPSVCSQANRRITCAVPGANTCVSGNASGPAAMWAAITSPSRVGANSAPSHGLHLFLPNMDPHLNWVTLPIRNAMNRPRRKSEPVGPAVGSAARGVAAVAACSAPTGASFALLSPSFRLVGSEVCPVGRPPGRDDPRGQSV